ncbi:MAG: methyltransferase domain-containing protein [Alphaproteobacteria bacterium]|nr:methyltransferase domain-containing protein [Alphaproteobacteria bacterium]
MTQVRTTEAAALTRAALDERHEKLKRLPLIDAGRAWTLAAHLLLPKGSKIALLGCGEGAVAYALAVLRPDMRILATDTDRRLLNRARALYHLHNLHFSIGVGAEALVPPFAPGALNAVVLDGALHRAYSAARYNTAAPKQALTNAVDLLHDGGFLLVQDHVAPREGFVLLDLADIPSPADAKPEQLLDADFLVWFSEHARPERGLGCSGFFLEELAPPERGRCLFRLPHKWAAEFLIRRSMGPQARSQNMALEYAALTAADLRDTLSSLGLRLAYSAPQWEPGGSMPGEEPPVRLFTEEGQALSLPPVGGFVAVAQKLPERGSLRITERRTAPGKPQQVTIRAMRNERTGALVDIASRGVEEAQAILPYHLDAETGQLSVWLHDGLARGIVNAAPRRGASIDDRRWSGHMVEAPSFPLEVMEAAEKTDSPTQALCTANLLMAPDGEAVLTKGPLVYPAPDQIEERTQTWFLAVNPPPRPVQPRGALATPGKFHARGPLRAFDAQGVLDAISVGLVPNAQLEIQLLALFALLGLPVESRTRGSLVLHVTEVTGRKGLREWLDAKEEKGDRFIGTAGTAGTLRAVHSLFVEEGRTEGGVAGLASQDLDFVVPEGGRTLNTAIVLPLTQNAKGVVHAMAEVEHLPVPQRFEGNARVLCLPSFNLPEDIATPEAARTYVAERMGVLPDMVVDLGAPYHTHAGLTPQRVFPMAVATPPAMQKGQDTIFIALPEIPLFWSQMRSQHTMVIMAQAYRRLPDAIRLEFARQGMEMRATAQEDITPYLPTLGLPRSIPALPEVQVAPPPQPANTLKAGPWADAEAEWPEEEKRPAAGGHNSDCPETPRP